MLKKGRRTNPRATELGKVTGDRKNKNLKLKTKIKTEKNRKKQIKSKEAYDLAMKEIDMMMQRGESNLSEKEIVRLRILAEAAERYEDTHDPLPLPGSLPEIIRMRIYQMQLSQGFTAQLLGVSDAKFSLIMNGKQKPDVYFIKAVHEKLRVDANQILRAL